MRFKNNMAATSLIIVYIIVLVGCGDRKPDHRTGQQVVDAKLIEEVNTILIKTQDETVKIVKKDNHWIISGNPSVPVKANLISHLGKRLTDLKYIRFVSNKPETLARLELNKNKVVLLRDDHELFTLNKGVADAKGGFFIQTGNSQGAWLVDGDFHLYTTRASLIDTTPLDLDINSITEISIISNNDPRPLLVTRESGKPWTSDQLAEGESLNQENLNYLTSTISGFVFESLLPNESEEALTAFTYADEFRFETVYGELYIIEVSRPTQTLPVNTTSAKNSKATYLDPTEDSSLYLKVLSKHPKSIWAKIFESYVFKIENSERLNITRDTSYYIDNSQQQSGPDNSMLHPDILRSLQNVDP